MLDICSGGAQTPTDNTLYQHFVNITIILHTKNNKTPRIPKTGNRTFLHNPTSDFQNKKRRQIRVTVAAPNIYLLYYYNLATIDRQFTYSCRGDVLNSHYVIYLALGAPW